jgi:CRP-like cAMP-binding protein
MIAPDRTNKILHLRHILFDQSSDRTLQRLAEASQIREYSRRQVIFGPDPKPDLMYFVIAGRVKLSTYVPDGREHILALLERGDLFGEFAPGETSVPARAEAFDHRVVVGTTVPCSRTSSAARRRSRCG